MKTIKEDGTIIIQPLIMEVKYKLVDGTEGKERISYPADGYEGSKLVLWFKLKIIEKLSGSNSPKNLTFVDDIEITEQMGLY